MKRRTAEPLRNVPDTSRPFNSRWMDSAYQETLLPGAPWHTISEQLCAGLAERLPKQLGNPQRACALAHLLGADFMDRYFSRFSVNMATLESYSNDQKKRLYFEANTWLKSQLSKVALEICCEKRKNGDEIDDSHPEDELSEEMEEFLKHTKAVMIKSLEVELHHQEQLLIEETKQELTDGRMAVSSPVLQSTSFDKRMTSPSSTIPSRASSVETESARVEAFHLMGQNDPIQLTSKVSDSLAESLVKILECSPSRFERLAEQLHGRPLPRALRAFIWQDILYALERGKHGLTADSTERLVRERFGRAISRSVGELKIARATQSPIHRVIENSVVEFYEIYPAMASCRSPEMMREAVRALNVLYTYDRTYEPYLIHWLFPIQMAFSSKGSSASPEHAYELAMYLDLLNNSLFPTWPQVFAISELVMNLLKTNDQELYTHLQTISLEQVDIKAKDFVVELIHKERKDAERMITNQPEESGTKVKGEQLSSVEIMKTVADPRSFLRKWIGEGFVSVLNAHAIMFIWDQIFLQKWHSSVIQDFALAVMLLLRRELLDATCYPEMRAIFLYHPRRLLLADIRKAWLMIHKNSSYRAIGLINRLYDPPSNLQPDTGQ